MSESEGYSSDEEVPELDEADQNDDIDAMESEEEEEELYEEEEIIISQLRKGDSNHSNIIIVPDSERNTSDVIQKQEIVEAIGLRASQIEEGSPVFTDVSGLTNPIDMAWQEFRDRKNPLILERVVAEYPSEYTYYVEHWKVREMAFPHVYV